MLRGKVGMMASIALLALSSILLLGAPSAADHHLGAGTISEPAGGIDNLAPAAPIIVSATAADDGASVTVLFGRSTDDADGFQAASDDFTSGGTFVSSNNVAGYLVRRGDGIEFPVADNGADALAAVDPTVQAGQTYVYQAVAYDDAGNEGVSAGIFVDVGEDVLPPVPPVRNLKAVIERPFVTLSWDAPESVEGVEIEALEVVWTDFIAGTGIRQAEVPPTGLTDSGTVEDGTYALAVQSRATDGRTSDAVVIVIELKAPEVVVATVTFEATEEEANSIVTDEQLRADFIAAFIRATAELLGISEDRVVVTDVFVGVGVEFELLAPEDPEDPDAVTAEDAFVSLETAVESEPETFAQSVNDEAAVENPDLVIELAAPVVAEIVQVSVNLGEGFTGDVLSVTRSITNQLDAEDTITIKVLGDFSATLTGDQHDPVVVTTASGNGTFTLNADQTELTFSVTFTGLPSTLSAAHFHNAPAGSNGGVVRGFTAEEITDNGDGTGSIAGTWALTADDLTELEAGNLYVNLHTPENGGGEIRGQVTAGSPFSVSTDALTLGAGASGDFDITFSSDETGDATGTVSVKTSDPENPGETITVSASIVDRPPVISVDDTPLDFGEVAVGLSDSQTLSIGNDGEADLEVTLLILGTGFQATTATITVAGGESVDADITFAPEEGGDVTAILVVSSNDPETASVLIDLSGTGDAPIPADIDLVGSEFNFGGVPVGSTGTRSMVVRNVGETDLAGDISLAGDATFAIDTSGAFTLAGLEEITVVITFTPADESASTGTITITSDDADEPELTVSLSGAGVVGEEVCLDNTDDSIIRVGDFEGHDGDIDVFDFFAFADRFGSVSGDAEYDATFDIEPASPDGDVDFFDFFRFADDFGAFCTYTTLGGGTAFSASLDGDQHDPAVVTAASGSGTFTLNGAETELTFSITFTGLESDLASAHFHNAPAGSGGGVVRGFGAEEITDNGDGSGSIAGTWVELTAENVTELEAGNIYVNIHTTVNGGGEIRGQVIAD